MSSTASVRTNSAPTRPSVTTMAPTAETNDQNKTASEDPSRLDNGIDAEPLNILRDSECFGGKGSDLRRHKNAVANEIGPDVLEYYELRSKGLIEERPYESWGPDSPERAETIDYYFNCHVKQFFRPVDWNKGFTGRGIYRGNIMERPGLIGPMDEELEMPGENKRKWNGQEMVEVGEAAVRHNDEDFGPFGESRDEDVGPFGESREENVGPFGDVRDDLGGKMDNLMDFATRCLDQMYRKSSTNGATSYSTDHAGTNEVNTSDLWSGSATAPTVTQPAQDIAQSLVSKDGTPQSTTVKISNGFQGSAATNINITHTQPSTRKRLRDHSEVPDGKDLNPRANRIRIGAMNCNGPDIPTTSGNARTEFPRLLAAIPKVSKKRGREDSGDLDQDGMVSKRLRNSEWARKNEGVNNEHPKTYEGHTPSYVDSTSIDDHSTGKKNHEAAVICKASDTTIFQEAETADENHVENATTNTDNTTALAIAEWGTAHVFNSKGADIYFPRKVNTIDGNLERMRLPRPAKSGDGDWTTEDDEDIHSWIQDYGVRDWKRVAQATNRSEEERQARYLHMVTSRNIQAGRVPNDGVPERYPDLSPPLPGAPPPAISDRVLRPRNRRAGPGVSKIACGELTYDLKARKFPRLAKNGNLVDSHGNTILGIEGDIPFVTKPKTQGRKRKRKQKLRLTHLSPPPATCQVLL